MTSPPTPVARALRSVITPFGVDTIATPRPFMTLRNVVLAFVDAQARTGNALEALDDRTASVILQTDFQFRLTVSFGFTAKSSM